MTGHVCVDPGGIHAAQERSRASSRTDLPATGLAPQWRGHDRPCCECGDCHGPDYRLPMKAWADVARDWALVVAPGHDTPFRNEHGIFGLDVAQIIDRGGWLLVLVKPDEAA